MTPIESVDLAKLRADAEAADLAERQSYIAQLFRSQLGIVRATAKAVESAKSALSRAEAAHKAACDRYSKLTSDWTAIPDSKENPKETPPQ